MHGDNNQRLAGEKRHHTDATSSRVWKGALALQGGRLKSNHTSHRTEGNELNASNSSTDTDTTSKKGNYILPKEMHVN